MSNEEHPTAWVAELKEIEAETDQLERRFRDCFRAYGGPGQFHEICHDLTSLVVASKRRAHNLNQALVRDVASKVLLGHRLSEQDYFLARASGIPFHTAVSLGLSSFSDFAVYTLLHCKTGVIDPGHPVRTGLGVSPGEGEPRRVVPRHPWAVSPEDVRRDELTAEQLTFFEKHLPYVYVRFQPGDESE